MADLIGFLLLVVILTLLVIAASQGAWLVALTMGLNVFTVAISMGMRR